MIQAIYVISRNGVPIHFKEFIEEEEDNVIKATLFTGIISAIQTVLREIDAGEANYFTTATHEIFLEVADDFAVALVKTLDKTSNQAEMTKFLSEIITEITFQFEEIPETGFLTIEEQTKIEEIIDGKFSKWENKQDERNATKKLKDSLW
ncbi:MAG: roadblock/LC7 domain-containing protein [Candidatus Heimdallarchaeota archaeon]|nr:roadblock/LC7 domain-containing protein [Candidatus Heimdallarchaeota archaeon]